MQKIFISHAKEDREKAIRLYGELKEAGFAPWLDENGLWPGQQWEITIQKIITESDIFIACLSNTANNKVGFFQAELQLAYQTALRFPPDQLFIVPIRFDDCELPFQLKKYHAVNYFSVQDGHHLIKKLKQYFQEREKKEQENKQDYLLIYKPLFRKLPNEKLKQQLRRETQRQVDIPELNLLYVIAQLRGINFSSLMVDPTLINAVELHLEKTLKEPRLRSTALIIQAFLHHDYYEKRQQYKQPGFKNLCQQFLNNKELPDQELLQYLKFSKPFVDKLNLLLKWLK